MNLDPIRAILVKDWDPLGYQEKPHWHAEQPKHQYDYILPALTELLKQDPTEEQVMALLSEQEEHIMCFPSIGRERLRRPARLLLEAVKSMPEF